ncbi:Hypothetical protein SRAE_X000231900 [Strongyloides ratti]|uniref:Uncharacterized protein n=1 Tax=Strongyloides ratti TaxID=34506 RepID=A0A090KZC6_STRRB|nr:Hypothetical protein SRAE_X000231900 [Strongyloides ratti]CEF60584.1 Hypothetical protein SRAE_X000231900 [Strongyloides ratti]
MQVRCPECFNHNNPENSLKIPISNFESHFSLYHYVECKYDKKKYKCVEDSCIKQRGDRFCKSFLTEYNVASYKRHLIRKHFQKPSNIGNNSSFQFQDSTNSIESMEIDTTQPEISSISENRNYQDFLQTNSENDLWQFEEELDLFEEPFLMENEELMPLTITEWEIYYKKLIFQFFDNCPGTEKYFKQLKHFLTDAIAPLKSQETINAKCGLLKISCENIIKDGKKLIQNLDITDENEIIVPRDDINNESIRKDREFFYYLPLEESAPLLMKKLQIPPVEKLRIILYADDIQSNNPLSSHRATGSFLHVSYKIHLPGNTEVAKLTSKVKNIQTIGVIKSEVTKTTKYDKLLKFLIDKIENLQIDYKKKIVKFEIMALAGDHVFLQDVYHLPKSFNGNGGSCCRTCLIENRHFHLFRKCEDVNKEDVLRYNQFEASVKYPLNEYSDPFHDLLEGILGDCIYGTCQKIAFYDKKFQKKHIETSINWNEVEKEIRILNKSDKKSQNISTVIRDGYFASKLSFENPQKKDSFTLTGAEQLSFGRALWKLWSSQKGLEIFAEADTEIFLNAKELLGKILNVCQLTFMKKEFFDNDIAILEKEINSFQNLYYNFMHPETKDTMKLHSILHYPLFAKNYRSLWVINCIRFESSNRRIKKLHSISNNKTNPSFTIMGKLVQKYVAKNICKINQSYIK